MGEKSAAQLARIENPTTPRCGSTTYQSGEKHTCVRNKDHAGQHWSKDGLLHWTNQRKVKF